MKKYHLTIVRNGKYETLFGEFTSIETFLAIEKELGREVFVFYSRELNNEEYRNVKELNLQPLFKIKKFKTQQIMKTVRELNSEELEELKWSYFYDEEVNHDFEYPHEIPNETIFEHYVHIGFTEEDFSSNLKEQQYEKL